MTKTIAPIISIGTGNFHYWNLSLSQKLRYLEGMEGVSGIEISCVPHGTRFSDEELSLLSAYPHNTLHLWEFSQKDKGWMEYCKRTIPNFRHFVLHPNDAVLEDIDDAIEPFLSFENMDPRKSAYREPEGMRGLFRRFPEAKFTFDINHADENNILRVDFQTVRRPAQIHFSTVNDHLYPTYPEIDTPHALAHLDAGFEKDISPFLSDSTIVTLEGVFPPHERPYIENEIAFVRSLRTSFPI